MKFINHLVCNSKLSGGQLPDTYLINNHGSLHHNTSSEIINYSFLWQIMKCKARRKLQNSQLLSHRKQLYIKDVYFLYSLRFVPISAYGFFHCFDKFIRNY